MMLPRVSVVIPTYNHAHFLREALASVVAQDFSAWEAIVVNNYSTDQTKDVVAGFCDARIRLIDFSNNGVIGSSRNVGIRMAQGQFIAFLDSDDKWYPEKLRRCVAALDGGLDVICHAERWVYESGFRDVKYGPASKPIYLSLLYDGNCLSTSATVVRRERLLQIGGFSQDPDFNTAEDYDLWMRLARDGARIGFDKTILGEYRIHEGNASKAVIRHMKAVRSVVCDHLKRIEDESLTGRVRARRRMALISYAVARGLQNAGAYRDAWRHIFSALRLFPFLPKVYLAAVFSMVCHFK